MFRHHIALLLILLASCFEVSADEISGEWTGTASWPFIPIHAVNLPDGRVLTYGGRAGGQGGQVNYDIWDPSLGLGPNSHLTLPNTTAVDTFCSAMLLMPQTGNVLAMSGDSRGRNSVVRNQDVVAYDYRTESVRRLDRGINRQRWYSTPVMTGKGEVFLQAGVCWGRSEGACPERIGTTPEIYRPDTGWDYLSNISGSVAKNAFGQSDGMKQWWYPRSWLMGNGDIYTLSGGRVQVTMSTEGNGSIVQHETLNEDNFGATNSGVMYRPDKVLITGGGGVDSNGKEWNGRSQATLIDLTSGVPVVTSAAPMNAGRQWHNSTVLPDGTVLVTGGSTRNNTLDMVTNAAEIWDPETNTWTVGAEGPAPRLYHSVALLLQDGRVFTGGGGAPGPRVGVDGEVYSPPYLFKPGMQNRLSITSGPSVIESNNNYSLSVSDASRVSRVTMIGYGGATHSFNMGQRFVELNFSVQANGAVQILTPPNANHIPPGYYMIYVLDNEGIPSVAHTVRVFPDDTLASPDQEMQQLTNAVTATSFENNTVANGAFAILPSYENWGGSKGVEIWRNHRGYEAADGDSWIEIDVSGATTLNATFDTQSNASYTLSFFSSPRPGVSANSNSFEVFWNGQLLDTISENGAGLTALDWQSYSFTVVGTGGGDTLSFREYDSNGLGALLDKVTLASVSSVNQATTSTVQAMSFENNTLANGAFAVLPNHENWGGSKGVEVWKNHRGYTAADGDSWVEIDVRGASTLSATYDTQSNTSYTLSFFSSPRPGVSTDSNRFEVFWNDELLDTIAENGTGLSALDWQNHSYTVMGTGGSDTLSFREYDSNNTGALLDYVVLSSNPTLASALSENDSDITVGALNFGMLLWLSMVLMNRRKVIG